MNSTNSQIESNKVVCNDYAICDARKSLISAMQINSENGHENNGFLSEEFGFMPAHKPVTNLPESHHVWDKVANDLPLLYRQQSLRSVLDSMSVLSADSEALNDKYLCRASVLMSMFAHAYIRVEKKPVLEIPESIQSPWKQITRRLNRPEPFLSYMDLIVYNWKVRDSSITDFMRVENMDLLVPTVNNQEERVFYLTQVEILSQTSPVVMCVIRAQEAVIRKDNQVLINELIAIKNIITKITRTSLFKINPRPTSKTYVDPIVWAKTVAPFAVPLKEDVQGPSGTSSPFFHLMDVFLQRVKYEPILGQESLRIREWYPVNLRNFLEAVEQVSVPEYVKNANDSTLLEAYNDMFNSYAGNHGFLGVHKRKVYGYLQMAFKVGRSVTIDGFQGLFEDQTWQEVDNQLEETRCERPVS